MHSNALQYFPDLVPADLFLVVNPFLRPGSMPFQNTETHFSFTAAAASNVLTKQAMEGVDQRGTGHDEMHARPTLSSVSQQR